MATVCSICGLAASAGRDCAGAADPVTRARAVMKACPCQAVPAGERTRETLKEEF
jgi:hypothetical protein